jgi:hypothetical protein
MRFPARPSAVATLGPVGLRWVLFALLALCGQAQAANRQPYRTCAWADRRRPLPDGRAGVRTATLAEDALRKGIPMYFVTEAELTRRRWYWYDQHIATEVRYLRLSYQPLTRRWRLNVSSEPLTQAGWALPWGKTSTTLADGGLPCNALCVGRLRLRPPDPQEQYQVQLRFRLDLSQLPRPCRSARWDAPGWNLSLARSLRCRSQQ